MKKILEKEYVLLSVMLVALLSSAASAADNIFQSWTTDNGVKVYFYPSDSLPMVDLRMVYAAGSARDGEKVGVADMTSALMGSGADGQDANQLAARFEGVGARFNSGSLRDMAWVTLRSLTLPEMLNQSVEALADVLGKPDFPESEIELIRSHLLTILKNDRQDPGKIAEKAFFKAIYGEHPYSRSAETDDINSLTRDDVKAFFKRYYVTGNAQLSIVGKLTRDEAVLLADRVVRHMPIGSKADALPPVKPLEKSVTMRIKHPSAQSHILIGQTGVARGADDHFALYIANHGFGGSGFASILMDEVREKRGLAYSVYSYFAPMEAKGPFIIGLQTRNDQVEEAVAVVKENLQDYIAKGPSDESFAASIQNITGASPLKTDTNAKLAQYASLIGFYDLPLDYLEKFNGRIRSESRDMVHKAFSGTINIDKLVTVIVGGGKE